MSKHFNSGNAWGKVASVKMEKSESKTPYLSITLECPNELFGSVRTYGRLWGKDKIDMFLDHHKKHPGAAYKFRGFFSQYSKNGNRYSNYTFFNWQPIEGKEFRACFILKGQITAIEGDKIFLHIEREGQENYDDIEEDFEIYALNQQDVAGLNEGDIIQAKGMIRRKEAEDYFGGSPEGNILPFVMELKQLTDKNKKEVF